MDKLTLTGHLKFCAEKARTFSAGLVAQVAQTAAEALEELAQEKADTPTLLTITLPAAGWSDHRQTVTVSGVQADEDSQSITTTPKTGVEGNQEAYYDAGVRSVAQGANSITFSCQTDPTVDLVVYVLIQGVA